MEGSTKTFNEKTIEGIIIFLSTSFILCYLYVLSNRLFYPFELEWLEGYFLAGMTQIVTNQNIYAPPNKEFISLLYPPLYYLLSGGLAKILGGSFWTARLVSILSSFLSGFVIFQFVRKETKSSFCAFFTLGLFFASYQITGSWFDVARVDSLFMALSLSGIYLLRYYTNSLKGIFFAATFLSLAFFTKQAAIFFIIGSAGYLLFTQKEKCFIFTLTSSLFIIAGILLCNYLTDGWYWFHTFKVPLQHYSYRKHESHLLLAEMYKQYTPLAQRDYGSIRKLIDFFKKDLFGNIPFPLFFVFSWLLYEIKLLGRQCPSFFWTFILGAAFIASISMRSKLGGYVNTLIPAISVSLIFFGIAAGNLLKEKNQPFLRFLLYLSILLQFSMMSYNPIKQIPTADDYQAGESLIDVLSSFKGDVYVPFHSYYSIMAGKKMYAHKMPIEDIYIGFPHLLPQGLFEKIEQKGFSAIIYDWEIDEDTRNPLEQSIIHYYTNTTEITCKNESTFLPLSGLKVKPRFIYLPKK